MTADSQSRQRTIAARARDAAIRLGTSVTAIAGAVSLLGFLAAWAWPFELLCHFRVQYSALFLFLAVCMAVFRNWRWTGVAAVLAAVNSWEVLPFYITPGAVNHQRGSGTGLCVVSANLYSGNREPEAALDFLRQSDADVMALYEVTPEWAKRLSESLPDYPYRRLDPQPGNFGIAIYSRLPFHLVEFQSLSDRNQAIVAEFVHAGMRVRLIAAHTFPPGGFRTTLRDQQLGRLGELAREATGPVVVVGDLNVTPFSPPFRELCMEGGLRDARRGHGVCASWPVGRSVLAIPIDHCLVRDCQAGFDIGPDIGSDHLPVVVDVLLVQ